MARLDANLVLQLTDRVSGPAKGVGRSLDRLDDRMARSGRMAASEATAMTRAGPMMLAGAAGIMAPLAAGLGGQAIVTAAADFESAMTGIQKLAGTTSEETARLGEEIKALATSGDLAVSIEDIASAYARGAAAGLPIASLKEFATISAKAADAFGMSAEDVGNFAAKLKTSLAMTDDEVRKVFDLTNSLADAGIADESKIIDFMDRMGASLKTLGLNSGQSLALGSTFLNIGMTSETAATAMDALTTKLLTVGKLSGAKKNAFERYMGPVGKFAEMVEEDANGALLHMLDTVKELKGADKMAFLSEFIGQDHGSKVLRLSDAVAEYRRNLELANNEASWFGSLDTSYKLKLDDFWSQWQLVKNALAELMIDTGTAGMPAFRAALEGAQLLIAEIGNGMEKFKATVDITEVQSAMEAVKDLGTTITGLMNMHGSEGSPIERFFNRLAEQANTVSRAINLGKDVLQAVGLVEQDEDTPEVRQQRRDDFFQGIKDVDGGITGREINSAYQTTNRLLTQTPEENESRNAAGVRDWRSDYEASGTRYAPSEDPAFEARVRARQARHEAEAPVIQLDPVIVPAAPVVRQPAQTVEPVGRPVVNLAPPPIETVPIPKQRPEIDTSAYLMGVQEMQAARAGVEIPIKPRADLDISSALAKFATLRSAADRTAAYVQTRIASLDQAVANKRLDMGGLHRGD